MGVMTFSSVSGEAMGLADLSFFVSMCLAHV